MTQVFISYSRKDLAFVERLAEDLKTAGLGVWYDLSGLDGGTRWGREIQNAIQQCQIFIVVLSPNSVESQWVEREFMYADSLRRKIIPLLYQPCETPMWFINLHFIDVQGENYDSHFWVILKAMGVSPSDMEKGGKSAATASTTRPSPEIATPLPQGNQPEKKKNQRMYKFLPGWIIGLLGLVVVLAFGLWGLPRLAPIPTLTATATHTSIPKPTETATNTPTSTATFIPTPTPGIGSTWIRPADGMVMVYVPGGDYSMGSNSTSSEQPIHVVNLSSFFIDKTEVTNAMFAKCVQTISCTPTRANALSSYYVSPQFGDYPVIWEGWNDARSYCDWAGARLPTEAEWEKAARGTDGRIYPWGNATPNKSLLNYNGNIGNTSAVGIYMSGASPYGALDMAGNVWEWVYDWYAPNYYAISPASNPQGPDSGIQRVVRGGAYDLNEGYIRSTVRGGGDVATYNVGFRCARSAP